MLEKISEIEVLRWQNRLFAHSPCPRIPIAVGLLGGYKTLLGRGLLSPINRATKFLPLPRFYQD
jgi:hypothetical protein